MFKYVNLGSNEFVYCLWWYIIVFFDDREVIM